jgi:hypothetical protein
MENLLEVTCWSYLHHYYPQRNWPAVPRFDHADPIVAGYLPLANYGAYRISWPWRIAPGGPIFCNCAESAVALVMARNHLDKQPESWNTPVLEAMFPGGATINEMVRRLQRVQCSRFPIYDFEPATGKFHLVSGIHRKDNNAIVFLRADPARGLPLSHWTYTTVLPEEEEEAYASFDAVVYSQFPVIGESFIQTVHWRAEVTPVNKEIFELQLALGRACACDWNIRCEHEEAYIQNRRPGVPLRRITLDGERHVNGTAYGYLRGVIGRDMKTTRTRQAGMCLHLAGQKIISRKWVSGLAPVKMTTWLSKIGGMLTENDYAEMTPAEHIVISPLRVSVRDFIESDDVDQTTWSSVGKFFKRGVLEAFGVDTQAVTALEYDEPDMEYGATADLTLRLPRRDELIARLILRKEVTCDTAYDIVRRMAAEEKWDIDVDTEEMQLWLERVITVKGEMTVPPIPNWACWNCLREKKTYRHMCKECRKVAGSVAPEPLILWDSLVTHVGFRPLWSADFTLPSLELKRDVEIRDVHRNVMLYKWNTPGSMNVPQLVALFRKHMAPVTCRGYSRGPVFLGQEPKCFPRGSGTAALAFLVRLGVARAHQAQDRVFDLAVEFLIRHRLLPEIEPESWGYFISHFSGPKKAKNEEGRREEAEGWAPQVKPAPAPEEGFDQPIVDVKMKGFAKPERSYNREYDPTPFLADKKTEKPRFICSPSPLVLSRLGRWTHAQTKWLAREFPWTGNMFYAGCSTPEELNLWLNRTLEHVPDPFTIVDDISAMDSNHSEQSFRFHRRVRHIQFPYIHGWIEAAYWGEEQIVVRVGDFRFSVKFVNASGVSDTSYKNSLMCLLIRCMAIAHGFFDITQCTDDEVIRYMEIVIDVCCMAASGDDGLSRVPDKVGGVSIKHFSLDRYSECWAWAGFNVKVQLVPPNRWRMATFLAMRPIWAGHRYEWAPEPARRMRGMFWQFDNALHPIAWARGIATQVLQQARALPVLSDVCAWYLENTRGPIADVAASNEYSPFHKSVMSGGQNARATEEFCLDYHVTVRDIELFKRTLKNTRDVLVNFDAFVLHRIYAEES